MRKIIAIVAVAAAAMASGSAMADHDTPTEAEVTIPLGESGEAGNIYLDAETQGIWQESNGLDGLQTTPTDVAHTPDDDTDDIPADEVVVILEAPEAPEAPTPPGEDDLPPVE